jgi:hypothetical protein
MLRITDKAFRYVPSFSTDLAKRFKEIFDQQRRDAAAKAEAAATSAPTLMFAHRLRRTVGTAV